MDLTGGRTTLILNICALILALITNVEGTYIIYGLYGWINRSDWLAGFIPVVVMFIIRNQRFSYLFLFFHVILAIQMGFQARSVHLGTYEYAGAKYPLGYGGALFIASLMCLAIYGAVVLVRSLVRAYVRIFHSR